MEGEGSQRVQSVRRQMNDVLKKLRAEIHAQVDAALQEMDLGMDELRETRAEFGHDLETAAGDAEVCIKIVRRDVMRGRDRVDAGPRAVQRGLRPLDDAAQGCAPEALPAWDFAGRTELAKHLSDPRCPGRSDTGRILGRFAVSEPDLGAGPAGPD